MQPRYATKPIGKVGNSRPFRRNSTRKVSKSTLCSVFCAYRTFCDSSECRLIPFCPERLSKWMWLVNSVEFLCVWLGTAKWRWHRFSSKTFYRSCVFRERLQKIAIFCPFREWWCVMWIQVHTWFRSRKASPLSFQALIWGKSRVWQWRGGQRRALAEWKKKSVEKTFQLCFDWVGRHHFNSNFTCLFSEVGWLAKSFRGLNLERRKWNAFPVLWVPCVCFIASYISRYRASFDRSNVGVGWLACR